MAYPEIKNLFIPFGAQTQEGLSSAVRYALSLASQADAHVTLRALAMMFDPPYSLAPGFVAGLAGPANKEEHNRAESLCQRAETAASAAGLGHDARVAQHRFDDLVQLCGHYARVHDLTIIDTATEFVLLGRALFEEALFDSGRPVIIVPPGRDTFQARRILVAWDGSARAARSVNDAMPFLKGAEHVEIVAVANEKDLSKLVPGAELAPQLSRHGISVEVVDIEAKDGNAGHALRARAELIMADMIVMGAFARSRWRQMILGGVTNDMLAHATVPVFMAH